MPPILPEKEEFILHAKSATIVPVWCEIVSDSETPISAFKKLVHSEPAFLLESAEHSEKMGRYSFVGFGAHETISGSGKKVTIRKDGKTETIEVEGDPLHELERRLSAYKASSQKDMPRFQGGAVGYLSCDSVRWFEPTISASPPDDLNIPEMYFAITETVITFDHLRRRMRIVVNAFVKDRDPAEAYDVSVKKVRAILEQLKQSTELTPIFPDISPKAADVSSNTTREEYYDMVERAKEYIRAGDIFQIVPSQRFETPYAGTALDLYRALRFVNPSPYMFILQCEGGFSLVGSSPEVHVRLTDGLVEIRPIAGTKPRGKNDAEDAANAEALLNDPKERAEHLMLVDLARNDVGRIADFSSVEVSDFMTIERYSHVMHIVSHVRGTLRGDRNAFDIMRATFPAGTVSGAPKVRALQIINELEKNKRGTYAGAVGYFAWDGNLDSCIALRTVLLKDGKAYVQAGGGVVADSTPEGEYQETINKAMGVVRAIERANALGENAS
ncbi:MAG: anthranilate synthase component I [Chthoniobacterales bacterium]